VEVIHAGHEPSFNKKQMNKVIQKYLNGRNAMSDPVTWFNEISQKDFDHYRDQNW